MSSAFLRRALPVTLVALTVLGSFVMVGQSSPSAGQPPPPTSPEKKDKKDEKKDK